MNSNGSVLITGAAGSIGAFLCRRLLEEGGARVVGLDCPARESVVLAGSPGCTVTGPCGSIELDHGCIIAKRHIHMTPEDAERFGVKDKEIVQVKVGGERALIFDEVVCRVSPSYATFMHVDYDEINAASLFGKDPRGEIIKK